MGRRPFPSPREDSEYNSKSATVGTEFTAYRAELNMYSEFQARELRGGCTSPGAICHDDYNDEGEFHGYMV